MANQRRIGPVGKRVARNLRHVRLAGELEQADVARRLEALGYPLWVSAISKVEQGDRRVNLDDLLAFSVALGITPNRLLLPGPEEQDDAALLTPARVVPWRSAWQWACGQEPLPDDGTHVSDVDADKAKRAFRATNRPQNPGSPSSPPTEVVLAGLAEAERAVACMAERGLGSEEIRSLVEYALGERG